MKIITLLGIVALSLGSSMAFADDNNPGHDHGCPGHDCDVPKKEVCFNLVCYYSNPHNPTGFQNCRAAATFQKDVTKPGGGEISDDSNHKNTPQMEVTCDGSTVFSYNNSARRFTNLLGSRIQGESGPMPAILLPRGTLHSGAEGTSGDHVSPSDLEMDGPTGRLRSSGTCYIWTGAP